jgi:hypothetical protein
MYGITDVPIALLGRALAQAGTIIARITPDQVFTAAADALLATWRLNPVNINVAGN